MAYHCSVKTVSRSAGRSATAAAAYRAAAVILDDRTGLVHDYRKKRGVEVSEIILPPGAPCWAADRSSLWNAAETAETRRNSTVAREWEVLIPFELSKNQAIDLIRDYCQAISDRHRVAIEFSIHRDNPKRWDGSQKGARGLHAHILASTRRLLPGGFGEKSRELDARSTGSSEVLRWRQEWERIGNLHLVRAGYEPRLDHRSYLNRGLPLRAMPDLPPSVVSMERQGIPTDFGDKVRGILAQNKRILQSANEEALEHVRAREEFRAEALAGIRKNLGTSGHNRSATGGVIQKLRDAIGRTEQCSQSASEADHGLDESFEQIERIANNWNARRHQEAAAGYSWIIGDVIGKAFQLARRLFDQIVSSSTQAKKEKETDIRVPYAPATGTLGRRDVPIRSRDGDRDESGRQDSSDRGEWRRQFEEIAAAFLESIGEFNPAEFLDNPSEEFEGRYVGNVGDYHLIHLNGERIGLIKSERLGESQPKPGVRINVLSVSSVDPEHHPAHPTDRKRNRFRP